METKINLQYYGMYFFHKYGNIYQLTIYNNATLQNKHKNMCYFATKVVRTEYVTEI